jgi:hypothetical protein
LSIFTIEIDIAVHPAVKKYIAWHHDISPFVVSRNNYFGIFLQNSLVRFKNKPGRPDLEAKSKLKPLLNPEIYSDKLTLQISEDLWRRQGCFIHPKKQYDFNRMVEMIIERDMYFFMDVKTGIKGDRIYQSFYDFRDRFDLSEDDLSLKNMEKRYERYRKRLSA